jgi:hypothetical protein
MDQRHDPSIPWLKKLESSFKWEARILYIVAVGLPLYTISPLAGLAIAAGGFLLAIVMDAVFSILVTFLFLRPISQVLKNGRGVAQQSQGHHRMQKTKWHTLIGSTLAVVSTTALYINAILCFTVQGPFWKIPWLNIFVFGMNIDSILNDVGMVIVSGMLKDVSELISTALSSKRRSVFLSNKPSVQPEPRYVPNSQASETYTPDEVAMVQHLA